MSAVTANESESAVEGDPGVSATDWFVGVPVQLIVVYRWKTTVPVGFGTEAGVSAVRVTNTRSWTTVPATAVVITVPAAFRMSVRAVASPQFFDAFPEPPEAVLAAVAVVRVIVCPLTGMSDVAATTVVPAVAEVIVT
jgi:nicotinamide riboside transporter PnuC